MGRKHLLSCWMLISCILPLSRTCRSFLLAPIQTRGRVQQLHDSELPLSTIHDVVRATFIDAKKESKHSFDDLEALRFNREVAIGTPGSKECLRALKALASVSTQHESRGEHEERYISYLPKLISNVMINQIWTRLKLLQERNLCQRNGFTGANGSPSFHFDLIDQFQSEAGFDERADQMRNELLELVYPLVNGSLLRYLQELTRCPTLSVSNICIQQGKHGVRDEKFKRREESSHEASTRLAAVICLDDDTRITRWGRRHSLWGTRRSALSRGDAVVQTWDCVQDACLEPDLVSTTLIVWFTTTEQSARQEPCNCHGRSEKDSDNLRHGVPKPNDNKRAFAMTTGDCRGHDTSDCQQDALISWIHNWYLGEAQRGNTFALTQLGKICESGQLSHSNQLRAGELLHELRPMVSLPEALQLLDPLSSDCMARRFWLEAAVRGNIAAQTTLAKELVSDAFRMVDEELSDQTRLLAAVLLGIAAQQEQRQHLQQHQSPSHSRALMSLQRMAHVDVASHLVDHVDDIYRLPVVQVAQAACNFQI